jgi:hypothetical protein
MVRESRPGRIAIDLTFVLMLFFGALATVEKRMLMSVISALTILEFSADLVVEFNPSFTFTVVLTIAFSTGKSRPKEPTEQNLKEEKQKKSLRRLRTGFRTGAASAP